MSPQATITIAILYTLYLWADFITHVIAAFCPAR